MSNSPAISSDSSKPPGGGGCGGYAVDVLGGEARCGTFLGLGLDAAGSERFLPVNFGLPIFSSYSISAASEISRTT